ncbi:MAG: Fe(2+) transporter permease subunit FeoB [Gammaproteobacteria bacterium]|nr:Fe(2+) transporter permease subunit FeoB [Gammaproteobacteria bacterium]
MRKLTIGLIGNPNCGKTTLFNALTGDTQRVGNWPGVTVDRKQGYFEIADYHVEIVDLPGIYSLSVSDLDGAVDERIAAEYMLHGHLDLIVNVVDASNLERHLYLTTQLQELNIPIVLVVNMIDVANKQGIKIDLVKLAEALGLDVVAMVAHRRSGLDELKKVIVKDSVQKKRVRYFLPYSDSIIHAIDAIAQYIKEEKSDFLAIRLLEEDVLAANLVDEDVLKIALQQKKIIHDKLNEDSDILIADSRYGSAHEIVSKVVEKDINVKSSVTKAVDRVVLNRILGLPIFFAIMYVMFFISINIGSSLQVFFQKASDAIFVRGLAALLSKIGLSSWFVSVVTNGVGQGISTTLTFIPVLGFMFLLLALLEDVGYMARAGFVVDRLMSAVGLPGKAFVPMLIGFGCNVPAVLAARTLENKRDRILTIIMTPFMSCGARLAIYAVFVAAFFPTNGQDIVFLLYLIGIISAVLTGLLLRKTILTGSQSPLVTELPTYHLPTLGNLFRQTWCRLKTFITKAGKVIVPVCLLIAIVNNMHFAHKNRSVLENFGRAVTPIFNPIGIDNNNWPATVGLITGVTSKEVVVGTLNTLYSSGKNKNLKVSKSAYGVMYQHFHGKIAAFAYLLFVLLYFPCVAVIAAMFREVSWRWGIFSILWNSSVAYAVAAFFYQIATFVKNPVFASYWLVGIIGYFIILTVIMRRMGASK